MQQVSRERFKICKDKLRFLILSYLILSYAFVQAQNSDSLLRVRLNHVFAPIDKSSTRISSGFLAEYATPLVDIAPFDGNSFSNRPTQIDLSFLQMAYATWYSSWIRGGTHPALSGNVVRQRLETAERNLSQVSIAMIVANHHKIIDNAVSLGRLRVQNDQIYDTGGNWSGSGQWINPYEEKKLFVAVPVRNYTDNGQVSFVFKREHIFGNIPIPSGTFYTQLIVDFDDGLFNQHFELDEPITVRYTTAGAKTIRVRFGLNGHYQEVKFDFEVKKAYCANCRYEENRFEPPVPFINPSLHSGGNVYVQYSQFNPSQPRRIRKPLIVVEGYDVHGIAPTQQTNYGTRDFIRQIDINNLGGQNLGFDLNNALDNQGNSGMQGYDLVFLDFNNGADDIRKNALLLQEVIAWVNTVKQGAEPNVVLGYSMGGLVARYGLAQMVRNGQNTQTRLLITLDSPHHGANFPLGLQHLALAAASVRLPWFGGTVGDMNVQLRDLGRIASAPATQQMLIVRAAFPQGGVFYNSFLAGDYRNMVSLNTPYRIAAISLGSECGIRLFEPHRELMRSEGQFFISPIPLQSNNKVRTEIIVNALPNLGEVKRIMSFKVWFDYKILNIINVNVTVSNISVNNPPNISSYDGAPGGTYPSATFTGNLPNSSMRDGWWSMFVDARFTSTAERDFCFIPTPSALDVMAFNDASLTAQYINGIAPLGNPSRFSRFIAQEQFVRLGVTINNESHSNRPFTHRNGQWLVNEMENRPHALVSCNSTCMPAQTITIGGTLINCTPESAKTEFFIPLITSATYTWTTNNPNLQVVSGQGTNRVRVRRTGTTCVGCTVSVTYDSGCGATTITASTNGGGGFSSSDYPVTGPNEAFCWTRVYYSAPDLPGATNYQWIYPSDWTYVEGQGTRFLTLIAGSTNGSVGVRVANTCNAGGSPAFKTTYISCSLGGGGCSSYSAYPNPANEQLRVESSVSPCGSTTLSTNTSDSGRSTEESLEKEEFTIKLFNALGKLVKSGGSVGGELNLDVSNLPDGIYILQIFKKGKSVETKRIIVQKSIIPN